MNLPRSARRWKVSVVIPCFNEAATIERLLTALVEQTIPVETLQAIVVDGRSTDATRARVLSFAQTHPELDLQLIDNAARTIPKALNLGIAAAHGDVVIRLDAHSAPYPDYIERCLDVLSSTQAANAGGVWEIQPGSNGWIARSIAVAAGHWLGAGDARYRIDGQAGRVETVPFGAFKAEWLRRVGPFNERLLTNEDYEYNARILRAGGKIWFDPKIRSVYYARARFRDLAKQYARYGFWKARMLRLHPGTLRWRQALPPLFVAALLGLVAGSFFFGVPRWLLAVQLGLYVSVTMLAGLERAVRCRDWVLLAGLPIALWIMHLCWGGAFWAGWIPWGETGGHELHHG